MQRRACRCRCRLEPNECAVQALQELMADRGLPGFPKRPKAELSCSLPSQTVLSMRPPKRVSMHQASLVSPCICACTLVYQSPSSVHNTSLCAQASDCNVCSGPARPCLAPQSNPKMFQPLRKHSKALPSYHANPAARSASGPAQPPVKTTKETCAKAAQTRRRAGQPWPRFVSKVRAAA